MADTTTASGSAPGGLSWARFKAWSAEAGEWVWGTTQGAFNEKASFSQILVDAVIGMIPLVGDVTAVRDLIAVVIGLIESPAKREKVWEWVLLVVLLFALIPVFGGVIKGVGRIAVKVGKAAEALTGAARAAKLQEGAREIIAFLNRIGFKNAEKWFLSLRITEYQAQLLERFNKLMEVINGVLVQIQRKAGSLMPASLNSRIETLKSGLATLKKLAPDMLVKAVKELDQTLRDMQAYVRSGGETTSRLAAHEVAVGERAVTRADEARIIESGPLPARSVRGWKKNKAIAGEPDTYELVYKHEPGYPDLTEYSKDNRYINIEAFSGKIINRPLKPGEQIYRYFGPEGVTHRHDVKLTQPGGGWWGLGPPPRTAKEWREKCAVLDEWNRDGYIVIGTAPVDHEIKAAVGTISEQSGKEISGQYLPGGNSQAVIDISESAKNGLKDVAEKVVASGKAAVWSDPVTRMKFEIRPTGWTDANGIHGYANVPRAASVQTSRLGAREMATKENREVTK
ncbi:MULTISPECIES: hypothetical protein [Variovorax]|uniref:Uncharacterized protein n=1 Tax=Variovorax paradoxus TaxID=34073 RepID=A0A5Q0LZN7_VARPD|nr:MULTISPECIES: hypothetical protein [Variovorax]QFZ82801.1 hypothetical protein GFK26_08520 [Variovorax paradoxus]WPG37497.1 hypothetical protein RZE79_29120 [Variovorax boronicumulans]